MELRVAGAQLPVTRDIAANTAAIHRGIDFAVREGAQVLLTPEGSLSGYTHEFDAEQARGALDEVTRRARQAGLGLALGTCFVERADGRCYNQIRFYAPGGEFLGFHSKTLTCGSLEDPPRGEIEHYAVAPLRTFALGAVRVGGLICNDLWANPQCTPGPDVHLTQQLSRLGARVVFHAVNGGRSDDEWSQVAWRFHEANLQMRARAGRLWIVTVDNCHPQSLPCSAPSGVVNPEGAWVCRAPRQGEACFAHTLSLAESPPSSA
ncbi:MAG: carbon-nitrogen hydrolase family protein [Candidatus Latescibacterota bacterium]